METNELIETVDLHKSFGKLHVLKGVSETIHTGETVSIIGPSGGGKSTFLRCLNLLEVPDKGHIFFEGQEITGKKVDIDLHRQKMGMVFQHFNVFPHLSVRKNITLAPTLVKKMDKDAANAKAEELLERVGLLEKIDTMPSKLSGGQKQRLAIVRALAMEPDVMLFDGRTGALAAELGGAGLEASQDLAKSGMSTVIVTHEMGFAREVSDRVLFMDDGNILESGTSDQVFNHPQNSRLQEFLRKVL